MFSPKGLYMFTWGNVVAGQRVILSPELIFTERLYEETLSLLSRMTFVCRGGFSGGGVVVVDWVDSHPPSI